MIKRIPVAEISDKLQELLDGLGPDDGVLLTSGDRIVARLETVEYDVAGNLLPPRRKLGWAKGQLRIISDDDEHLDDFKEYMP